MHHSLMAIWRLAMFGLLALLSLGVHAQSTLYSNRSAWEAATGTTITSIDFSAYDDGSQITPPNTSQLFPSLTLRGVTFTSNVAEGIFHVGETVYGTLIGVSPFWKLRTSIPLGSKNFGFDLVSLDAGAGASLLYKVQLSNGENFQVPSTGLRQFLGIVSSSPISWVEIFFDDPVNNADMYVDNFYFTAPPSILNVVIDINPGSTTNPIKIGDKKDVVVAILSTATFNVDSVNVSTVRFGRTGTEAIPTGFKYQDVNGDGRRDLRMTFRINQTGIQVGDTRATLKGQTTSGTNIEGSDSVYTVPPTMNLPF